MRPSDSRRCSILAIRARVKHETGPERRCRPPPACFGAPTRPTSSERGGRPAQAHHRPRGPKTPRSRRRPSLRTLRGEGVTGEAEARLGTLTALEPRRLPSLRASFQATPAAPCSAAPRSSRDQHARAPAPLRSSRRGRRRGLDRRPRSLQPAQEDLRCARVTYRLLAQTALDVGVAWRSASATRYAGMID